MITITIGTAIINVATASVAESIAFAGSWKFSGENPKTLAVIITPNREKKQIIIVKLTARARLINFYPASSLTSVASTFLQP